MIVISKNFQIKNESKSVLIVTLIKSIKYNVLN